MKRRPLLVKAGATLSLPLAGCLTETTNDETRDSNRYRECHLTSIDYDWLPEEIQNEVDAVFDDGSYEAERVRFVEAVDTPRSYLVVEETPYEPIVERSDETQTLTLHETDAIRAPTERVIRVENEGDREHEIQVKLTDTETILAEGVTLQSGERTTLETTDTFGTYDLAVQTDTGDSSEERFTVGDGYSTGYIRVSEDDIRIGQDMAEVGRCSWHEQ